jgi:glycosyltransferase involved in cell wall biosynthesis
MHIDIVAFDVPLPADYGGAIDVFYRLKNLHAQGAKITLHCFEYGRGRQPALAQYCDHIHYYPRTGAAALWALQPYITRSRRCPALLQNLLAAPANAPIIFEGIHTCAYLHHPALHHRPKWVRIQNIEHIYYKKLAEAEGNIFKKMFYWQESIKLKYYEKQQLRHAQGLFTISTNDQKYYEERHQNAVFLPASHPYMHIDIHSGVGDYVLYHGNLSVVENVKAAEYIAQKIAGQLPHIPFVIAGKNPPKSLYHLCKNLPNMRIIANPAQAEMQNLITQAQVHLLVTFQDTGIKLKVLASLHTGRHCVVNPEIVAGAGIDSLCIVASDTTEMINAIKKSMLMPFDKTKIAHRQQVLSELYDNTRNAKKIIEILKIN